jgi:DNA-binding MarR family transcriptional regulator
MQAADRKAPARPAPRISYVIGRLDRALRRQLDESVGAHGLTALQYTTLSVLRARSGLSNAQLARRSFMTPQSMSEVLARLEQKGLIRRGADPDHGRILRVELTPAGHELLAACDRAVDGIEEAMLEQLTPDERETFAAWLTGCVRMLGAGLLDH